MNKCGNPNKKLKPAHAITPEFAWLASSHIITQIRAPQRGRLSSVLGSSGKEGRMQHAKYIRLYTDGSGESHFEDLEIALVSVDFAPPAAPLNIAQFLPTAQSLWVGAPVEWGGEKPHPSPHRQIFCILQGEFEVTASDGTVRRFPAGSVLLLEDTRGKGHSTRVISKDDALIFCVVLADS